MSDVVKGESSWRLEEARRTLPPSDRDTLPTLSGLIEVNGGYAWLKSREAQSARYLSPWPCTACGGHVYRVHKGQCAACHPEEPAIATPPPQAAAPDEVES